MFFLSRYARYSQVYVKTIDFFSNSTYIYTCTYISWGSNPRCNCSKLKIFKHASYVCLESFEPYFFTLKSSSSSRVILDVPGYSIQKRKAAQQPKLLLTLSFEKQTYLYCHILPLLVCHKTNHFLVVKKTSKELNAAGI